MFTDPTSITENGVAISLPRISQEGLSATYKSADQNYTFLISHQPTKGSRLRHMVRVDKRAIVPDPLTAVNDYETLGVYLVIDRPEVGFSATQVDYLVQALKGFLTTANVTKVFSQES